MKFKNVKRGDFGLTPGKSLAMAVTRYGTFSRYGHAALAIDNEHISGQVTIIEAAPSGARYRLVPVSDFIWSDLPLTPDERQQITSYAMACLGYPYDWPAILGFILRHWRAAFTNQSPDHPDDKVICSELVAWAYKMGSRFDLTVMPDGKVRAPGDTSPGDLMYWMLGFQYGDDAAEDKSP